MDSSTQHSDHAPLVVAILRDLFFGVKIAEAARRAGGKARFVTTEDDLLAAAASHPAMAVFDLQQRDLQPARLLRRLKQNPDTEGIPTLGYFSHVQEELRTEALEAGCDTVLPRSKFAERVEELVGDAVRRALQTRPHG